MSVRQWCVREDDGLVDCCECRREHATRIRRGSLVLRVRAPAELPWPLPRRADRVEKVARARQRAEVNVQPSVLHGRDADSRGFALDLVEIPAGRGVVATALGKRLGGAQPDTRASAGDDDGAGKRRGQVLRWWMTDRVNFEWRYEAVTLNVRSGLAQRTGRILLCHRSDESPSDYDVLSRSSTPVQHADGLPRPSNGSAGHVACFSLGETAQRPLRVA